MDSHDRSPAEHLLLASFLTIFALLITFPESCFSAEFTFDMSEVEKKPYSFSGYLESKLLLFGLDQETALYRLRFYDQNEGNTTHEFDLRAQLDLGYQHGLFEVFVQPDILYTDSYRESGMTSKLLQSYFAIRPWTPLSVYVGKRSVKWGKGYAWNPVGFIERAKDPNDPDLAREGYVLLGLDWTKSFDGALKTITLSPVLLPVHEKVNADFGQVDQVNVAGKLYLLLFDTDIDLMCLVGESKADRFGADISKNLTSNFEVHGEAAVIDGFKKKRIDAVGQVTERAYDAASYLLGLRYLTAVDTTYILEFYHNEAGFDPRQMMDYYSYVDSGYQQFLLTGDTALWNQATSFGGAYGGQNPMRQYLYLRVSQKDTFGILYLTPALSWIQNFSDDSFFVSPEIIYKGFTNREFQLKCGILSGEEDTEYGEKQNNYKTELRIRYYF